MDSIVTEQDQLLDGSTVEIVRADPSTEDARWCFEQYFKELGERFEGGFNPALSISAQPDELRPPAGLLLLAYLHGEPVGCGALKLHETVGEVKRMWVSPNARGLGMGKRMLLALEKAAREFGISILHLETNRALTEAISLYKKSGYQEVDPFNSETYAHHWFEKHL